MVDESKRARLLLRSASFLNRLRQRTRLAPNSHFPPFSSTLSELSYTPTLPFLLSTRYPVPIIRPWLLSLLLISKR
jgi:hypothetical protein